MNCPTCGSPDPKRHPALQYEGEVSVCPDDYHPRTEHTITSKEIVALLAEVVADPAVSSSHTDRVVVDCHQAEDDRLPPRIRMQARARCAEIYNARRSKP